MTGKEEIITEQAQLFRAFTDWLMQFDIISAKFKSEIVGYTSKLTENALKIGVAQGITRALETEGERHAGSVEVLRRKVAEVEAYNAKHPAQARVASSGVRLTLAEAQELLSGLTPPQN